MDTVRPFVDGKPKPPAVSVVICVVDPHPVYFAEAVESVLGQTFADFELLVVDDGSSDDSVAVLRSHEDARLRLERNEHNLGLVATLNGAVQRARGRYIARMDADDVSLPTRLAEQVAYLDSHPEVSGVSAAYETIDEQSRGVSTDYGLHRPVGPALVRWSLHFGSFFCHAASMLRREVFDALELEHTGPDLGVVPGAATKYDRRAQRQQR